MMNEVKRPKKPLIFYYVIVMVVLLLINLLTVPWLAQRRVQEVDYGTFVQMAEDQDLGLVEVQFFSELGAAHCHFCAAGPVDVQEADGTGRRSQCHELWQIQRQGVCQVL